MAHSSHAASAFRTDIQALRGWAVLLVLVYHARIGVFGAGYLGVDVFFVVSGYLITRMIAGRIDRGDFSFVEFYFRRAKRLFPAAYATFLLTTVAAVFALDFREWRDYLAQLAGAVSFTGNFVLWRQTGYFDGAAELKPLLHIWTLAIEEQYYLLLPAALVLIPHRRWLLAVAATTAASLALAWMWAQTDPNAAFYLLPARAWELGLGSLAFLAQRRGMRFRRSGRILFWPSLLVLAAVPAWPLGFATPLGTLLVCTATMVAILREHPALDRNAVARALAWIGDRSYSLYLVHWPILAFLANARAGDPTAGRTGWMVSSGAVAAAMILGYLLHRIVEQPVRSARFRPSLALAGATVLASLLLAVAPALALRWTLVHAGVPFGTATVDRRDNVGFDERCDFYRRFDPIEACRNSERPRLMVWGDSFAMHLIPGLAATTGAGVLQATKSSCGPFLDLAQVTGDFPRGLAEYCLEFNRSVLDFLSVNHAVEVVALASPFYPYFDRGHRRLLQRSGTTDSLREPSMQLALEAMSATIERLRESGKRVVLVAPPPSTGFDYTHCLERQAAARTLYAAARDCNMPRAEYLASKREVLSFLRQVQERDDVDVVDFDGVLCDGDECRTAMDGTFIYRDEGHFSTAGSRLVARKLELGEALMARAR